MATATMPTQLEREPWRFSIEDYERMFEIGVLNEDSHVELIDGEVLAMSPMGLLHRAVVRRLNTMFARHLLDKVELSPQLPVVIRPRSMPEPDYALIRLSDDDYIAGLPGPSDILLVIEVADSSVRFDRQVKMPLYARAGIQEMWLVDLTRDVVVVATEPSPDGYRNVTEHRAGDVIAPQAFPDATIDIAALLRR